MASKFNARNPSVKRIQQEIREFARDPSPDMIAEALEENIFEWHFVVRGAVDSEFEGGLYHGRILLPAEYPFKPPAFLMLTPNGRFETGQKVCLSISSHHPEHWQPSWSVRTALVALVAFMQTPGGGAIASLDYTKDDRRELARLSRLAPPVFGSRARQDIISAAHETMLRREAVSQGANADAVDADAPTTQNSSQPQNTNPSSTSGQSPSTASSIGSHIAATLPAVTMQQTVPAGNVSALEIGSGSDPQPLHRLSSQLSDRDAGEGAGRLLPDASVDAASVSDPLSAMPAASQMVIVSSSMVRPGSSPVDTSASAQGEGCTAMPPPLQDQARLAARGDNADVSLTDRRARSRVEDTYLTARNTNQSWEDTGLTAAAVAIMFMIAALLVKKVVFTAGAASYQTASFL